MIVIRILDIYPRTILKLVLMTRSNSKVSICSLEFIFQAYDCNSYRHIGILMINFRVYGNGLSASKDYGINCFKEIYNELLGLLQK